MTTTFHNVNELVPGKLYSWDHQTWRSIWTDADATEFRSCMLPGSHFVFCFLSLEHLPNGRCRIRLISTRPDVYLGYVYLYPEECRSPWFKQPR